MISSILKVINGIVKLRNSAGTIIDPATESTLSSVNTSVNTLLKPASTLSAVTTVTTVSSVTAIANALPTGTNSIGQVTANAGTNLNTSLLALESTQAVQNTRVGDLTEASPASDTASAGLNGRLQRIAQRISSLIISLSDRTQKTQITNGTIDAQVLDSTILLNANALVVRPIPYEPQTYSASADGFTVAAAPTDVFTITGSATKTIRVHKIRITGTTTSGSAIKLKVSLVRRSTADSGGTRVSSTVVPHDSTNASGTCTVGHYTANPTLGTTVGVVRSASVGITASGLAGGDLTFEFLSLESQPVILRGVSEQLAINFNSIAVTGSVISISVEWSEV